MPCGPGREKIGNKIPLDLCRRMFTNFRSFMVNFSKEGNVVIAGLSVKLKSVYNLLLHANKALFGCFFTLKEYRIMLVLSFITILSLCILKEMAGAL